jgi:ADP-ribosyl-[dinitrogen reductase] hydrolase
MGSGESLVPGRPFPGTTPSPQRIRAGILAYAAGDAIGVPWEGKTADQVNVEALEELPPAHNWPQGATSDDTDQLMLVARHLVESRGRVDEREFLTLLAKALPGMRGPGPSTTAAVRRFLNTGAVQAPAGNTVGAAMRALPIGWAMPPAAAEQRRATTIRLSRTTHGAPSAIASACMVAAMASCALERWPINAVVKAGLDEAQHMAGWYGLHPDTMQPIRQGASGAWEPYRAGMALDAVATVASVMQVLRESQGLATAMKHAVSLGGDTDTVAAIVGGILGCQSEDVKREIPWLSRVSLPEPGLIEAVAIGLDRLRRSLYQ